MRGATADKRWPATSIPLVPNDTAVSQETALPFTSAQQQQLMKLGGIDRVVKEVPGCCQEVSPQTQIGRLQPPNHASPSLNTTALDANNNMATIAPRPPAQGPHDAGSFLPPSPRQRHLPLCIFVCRYAFLNPAPILCGNGWSAADSIGRQRRVPSAPRHRHSTAPHVPSIAVIASIEFTRRRL